MTSQTSLTQIISFLERIRNKTYTYDNWLKKSQPNRLNAFIIISKNLTIILELLRHYKIKWDEEKIPLWEEMDRIKTITTMAYISTFSTIEYCIKEMIKHKNHKDYLYFLNKWKNGDYVMFKDILNKFKEKEIIDQNEYNNWDTHRKIRNITVHNNVIPFYTANYDINGLKINFVKDKPIKSSLDLFIMLIESITERYYLWLKNYIKTYN